MNGDFIDALRQIEKEKEIPFEQLVELVEVALTTAYRRRYAEGGEVKLRTDVRGRGLRPVLQKHVVETVENSHRELSLSDAQRRNPMARVGDTVDVEMPAAEDFGRIAAQTAKQVVVQRIREAERDKVFDEFGHRVGEVVTGVVQRRESRGAYILLGKIEAMLPSSEQVPGEPYRFNDRLKVYLLEVRKTAKGPQVIVSRSHPSMIRRLFELEVPEIEDETVLIKSVAREAGHRSKIAVASAEERVDPVGACVGHRGSRVQAVVNELYGEKIDIIRWYENPADFIREALSPAKAVSVTLNEELKSAYVIVPDAMLSLAIGKEGQNVRLAARLTGWRIDIRSESQDRDRKLEELATRDLERQDAEALLVGVGGAEAAEGGDADAAEEA